MKRILGVALATVLGATSPAATQSKYDSGREITIGNIVPYSGPLSNYSVYGKVFEGYFNRVNERGGIQGRKIKLISVDDAYYV